MERAQLRVHLADWLRRQSAGLYTVEETQRLYKSTYNDNVSLELILELAKMNGITFREPAPTSAKPSKKDLADTLAQVFGQLKGLTNEIKDLRHEIYLLKEAWNETQAIDPGRAGVRAESEKRPEHDSGGLRPDAQSKPRDNSSSLAWGNPLATYRQPCYFFGGDGWWTGFPLTAHGPAGDYDPR